MITRDHFVERVGHEPENDDLDRCNCPHAGEVGHYCCGWNKEKDLPVFVVGWDSTLLNDKSASSYPFIYRIDNVDYRTIYRHADAENFRPSRVYIERVDGRPVKVGSATYPGGYVVCYGDEKAKEFLERSKYFILQDKTS